MNLTLRPSVVLGCATLALTACPQTEVIPNVDHCVNQDGDAYCARLNANAPFCSRGECSPESLSGCVATRPTDACYSPCGEVSLAEDPSFCDSATGTTSVSTSIADESAGPITTTGVTSSTSGAATTEGSTGFVTGTTGDASTGNDTGPVESSSTDALTSASEGASSGDASSTTGPSSCLDDTDCPSPAAPACDPASGTCVPCSAAQDPDAACRSLEDPARIVCDEDVCVACTEADDRGCPDDAPVCDENTCVVCSEDDIGACDGQCLENTCVECLGPEDCEGNAQRPVCDGDNLTCVACTADDAGACASDPENPVCDPVARACVPCSADDPGSCADETPVCDLTGDSPVCAPCTSHADCSNRSPGTEGSACDLERGSCLDDVFHVDGDPGCNNAGNGTEATPFCTIDRAVGEIAVNQSGTIVVHESADPYDFVQIANGRRIALIAATGEQPRVTPTSDDPNLAVSNDAAVFVDGLRFEDGDSIGDPGIQVEAALLVLDRTIVSGNLGTGISAISNADLTVRRSQVVGNGGNGITISGGTLLLENSFVTGDNGIVATGPAVLTIVYASIAAGNDEEQRAVRCVSESSVTVRNSVLLHNGGGQGFPGAAFACPGAAVSRSAFTGIFGGGNAQNNVSEIDQLDESWPDAWFVDYLAGDLHLREGHPFDDVARWMTGDPTTDLDGQPRPTTNGDPDVAGADRLVEP